MMDKCSSPSFNEIEFTTLFPCATLSPASIISHINHDRHENGSAAIKFRILSWHIQHSFIHINIDDLRHLPLAPLDA
jgi:hypothetical protein